MRAATTLQILRATGQGPPSRRVRSSALLQFALQAQLRSASPLFALVCACRAAALLLATGAVGEAAAAPASAAVRIRLIASLAWLALEPARLACGYRGNLRESADLVLGAALLSLLSAAASAALLGRAAHFVKGARLLLPVLSAYSSSYSSWPIQLTLALHSVDLGMSAIALLAAATTAALSARAALRFSRARRRLLLKLALSRAVAAPS
jgi:hypothetical protein